MVDLLQAKGLEYAYGGEIRALAGMDLELAGGEMLAVLGPNGSGKSTLVKMLSGLLQPDAGKVLLGDREIRSFDSRERARRVAVVPQVLDALPGLRVADFVLGGRYSHLGFWRSVDPRDHSAVQSALDRADVGELADRMLSELSGGQRQRVLVARALAQEAEILLCDEPTASLDPEHQLMVLELLRGVVDAGMGVVLVSHDFNLVSQFADRIVLVDEGRGVAEGAVSEVLREEVLASVYGSRLLFGEIPGADAGSRPMVLPWRWGESS
ncbi:MAG: ABC transporter ATP-binding protein [Planctomycetota bacterium]|jgi:iron complex transport system ATP-binding protein